MQQVKGVFKGVKTIGVHPEAYEVLRGMGKVNESFAIVIDRLLEERSRFYEARKSNKEAAKREK